MKMKIFEPAWRDSVPVEKSYRSIFKWGAPDIFKHPNQKLYNVFKETFNLDVIKDSKHNYGNSPAYILPETLNEYDTYLKYI